MTSKKNNETTLTHLTKRFVKLLNANSDRVVNLNEASTRLSVAKRRIYDITNVLEGIGLLQKTSKNVTRWVDCPRDSPYAAPPTDNNNHPLQMITPNGTSNATDNNNSRPQSNSTSSNQLASTEPIAGLNSNLGSISDAELLALVKTYQKLEEGVNDLEANIRQQLNTDGAYVTYHDIKSSFNNQTVIAVKAPPETRLEVNENLQINIKSENGQIEVYLYQHNNNSDNSETHQQLQNVYQTQQTPSQNLHLQQQQTTTQPLNYNSVSSDEGRGRSTTDGGGVYYDPTSGTYDNDPTLSSALSNTVSEDEDPFKPIVPFEGREEPPYNFVLDEDYTITSLFPEDNLGYF